MIVDITNEVLDKVKSTLSPIPVLSAYPSVAPSFPCVILEEIANDTDADTVDTSGETHNLVGIEVNVFTQGSKRVTDARTLRTSVDAIMSDYYGMTRTLSQTTPNFLDSSIYRYTLRYIFTIDSNKTIYRR